MKCSCGGKIEKINKKKWDVLDVVLNFLPYLRAQKLAKDIDELVPSIEQKLMFDPEKPIECPLNSSMNKYLEFSLKNRNITPSNLNGEECERIEGEISSLLEKYKWTIKKR